MCKGHLWVFAICVKRRDAELSIRSSPRPIMAWKFLAIFLVLTCSVESTANQKKEQARNSNCKDSEPFFIKNRSAKAKKPYLTVDLKTNAVNGGKKSGETNQQWMWRETGDCDARASKNLVNVATGGCLTRKGRELWCHPSVKRMLIGGTMTRMPPWRKRHPGSGPVWSKGSLPCGLSLR